MHRYPKAPKPINLLLMYLLLPTTGLAQNNIASTSPGIVSGRVFAILENGDLRPARMATVYLLWKYRSSAESLAEVRKGIKRPSAELTYLDEYNKAKEAELEEMERDNTAWSDSKSCRKDLRAVDHAIEATIQWSLEQKKPDQVLTTQADEEGNFRMTGVRPGVYDVIARGRAGFNEAFWDVGDVESGLKDITVVSGREMKVKLGSPVKACYGPG
jgi:hypothetical protein